MGEIGVGGGIEHRTCGRNQEEEEGGGDYACWSSLRAVFGFIIPCCACSSKPGTAFTTEGGGTTSQIRLPTSQIRLDNPAGALTGTIFGHRRGRVNFCLQEDPSAPPLLHLELATPTYHLVKEMESGLLRITLECETTAPAPASSTASPTSLSTPPASFRTPPPQQQQLDTSTCSLFDIPVWSMYCNGRKVGFAVKKPRSEQHPAVAAFIGLMQSVSTGAGVIPPEPSSNANDEELIYMRATYKRVSGSRDSEAFHMINPDGASGQDLSIFLHRSS